MACCLLLSAITASWAQKSLPVTRPVSLSDSEYVINGPVEAEVGIGRVYTYTRYLPKGAGSVYWYVEGARLINGKRARLLKEGYLNARQYPELRIEWDSIKTAQGQGLLQLRQRRLQRVAVNKVPQQAGTLTSADLTGDETVEVLAEVVG